MAGLIGISADYENNCIQWRNCDNLEINSQSLLVRGGGGGNLEHSLYKNC